ncbi:MAG: carbon-nitrogen hydrolase family protein [Calditrichaeota bacterium]|nr:MAG: carbon-nitrogen hydrolase family protein [Calditrichota bacterium]
MGKKHQITVALAQFAPQWKELEENMEWMFKMIKEAGKVGAHLVIFPELSYTGYPHETTPEELASLAETLPSSHSRNLAREARNYNLAVVYGMLEKAPHGAYNTVVWLEKDLLFRYRKTHVHWNEKFTPGEEFPLFPSHLGTCGALVCFDLAFPETARTLALKGATMIVAPSAVPEEFKKINRQRVIARALDNQIFVFYCNYTGDHYGGGSLIVGPGGDILLEATEAPGLYFQTIDLSQIDYWRHHERIYEHLQFELIFHKKN